MSKRRECKCCGTTYAYCGNCGNDSSKPHWMALFDKEECKDIFNAVSGYNMGIKNKAAVKAVVDEYGITDFSKFNDGVKDVLEKLFSTPEVERNTKKKKNKRDMDIDLQKKDEEEHVSDLIPDFDEEIS